MLPAPAGAGMLRNARVETISKKSWREAWGEAGWKPRSAGCPARPADADWEVVPSPPGGGKHRVGPWRVRRSFGGKNGATQLCHRTRQQRTSVPTLPPSRRGPSDKGVTFPSLTPALK